MHGGWRPWCAQGSSDDVHRRPGRVVAAARGSRRAPRPRRARRRARREGPRRSPRRRGRSPRRPAGSGSPGRGRRSASSSARRRWARSSSVATKVMLRLLIDWSVNTQSTPLVAPRRVACAAMAGRGPGAQLRALGGRRSRPGSAPRGCSPTSSSRSPRTTSTRPPTARSSSSGRRPSSRSRSSTGRSSSSSRAASPSAATRARADRRRRCGPRPGSRPLVAVALRARRARAARAAPGRPASPAATTLYWIYVGAVLAFAASFFARGYLAGEGRFGAARRAAGLASRSRGWLFSLAVAVGIAAGRDAVAAGIVAAPLFSLAVVPLAFVHRATRRAPEPAAGGGPARARDAGLAGGGAFAAAVLLIMLSEQIFLNAGPLLVRARARAPPRPGYIFNVLMLARAPLLVFQGIAISLLPHLTRLRSRGGDDADARGVRALGRRDAAGDRRVHRGGRASIVAIAGPALMQVGVLRPLQLRPRRPADRHRRRWASTSPRRRSTRPRSPRARRAAPRPAGSPARVGFLVWSVLADPRRRPAGSRSASSPPPRSCSSPCGAIYREPARRDGAGLSAGAGARGRASRSPTRPAENRVRSPRVRLRADPGRRAAARGRARRREGRRPRPGPGPAALPRPRDAGRLRGHRRGRVRRRTS